jgi:NADPH-dependent 2,4-dienoyl-CoA reductase/sulfur reductase-like enzyme
MREPVSIRIDGRAAHAAGGDTVAAALANASVAACRVSTSGEPRGPLCAMGICFECRVTIDGEPHRRACMVAVREGMEVVTGPAPSSRVSPLASQGRPLERLTCDVAVVGGGPAGVAAASRAAEEGAEVVLLDENAAAGGQIYRRRPGEAPPERFGRWMDRLARSGARTVAGAAVYEGFAGNGRWRLFARREDEPGGESPVVEVSARRVVLATGAREIFLPFPGWTLPGVMGAAGAQALWKSGAALAGRRVVAAGSGPLLLAAAASLAKAGAALELVAEQAPPRALAALVGALAAAPERLLEAARYRAAFLETPYAAGWWVAEARGRGRLESVVVTDGEDSTEIPCDLAAVGWGLVPNRELPALLGCSIEGGAARVSESQESTVPGVFCAGETCGVAGVDVALAEGEIAGAAAAGAWRPERPSSRALLRARAVGRRLARAMDRAFRLRPELRSLPRPDTVVCRCEDAAAGSVARCGGSREAKLAARAGMGPCQGRVCGPALAFLFGWDSDTVRPPAQPASLAQLAAAAADEDVEEESP